ncbi:MAG TPA: DNA polymerase III subunit gamma/tau [Candidatus Sulfotelmatobacter sp.]|nr:DNA polymerase III subunit gamma/tau [Candidatus Sulfotelmatobacter sp.]
MAYQVIARKWRPQTFRDLTGQGHVTDTLANAIRNDRVAHAYIFSGARGVGKTTAARILAKALNCVHGPTADPCGECDSCKEIATGSSLDVIEIDAASNRGIDQIRELREMVRYAPAGSRNKVVILDEAHMLTSEASNALLKTLEEPPDRVIFVMATTEPENLVDTIRSRSQHFHFRALTFAEITARLEEIASKENLQIEPGALAVIARMAEGSMRDALSLLEQARAYCGDTIPAKEVRELLGVVPEDALEELINAIAAGSADRALALVHSFQKEGRNLQHFCREAIRHIRNILIARVSGAASDLIAATPDQRPALERAAALFSEEDLTRFFQILLQTDEDLRRKLDPRVHLEMGLLRLINAARLAPLEELMAEVRSGTSSAPSGGSTRSAAPSPVPSSMPKRELPSAPASPLPFTPPARASAAAAGASSPQPVPFRPAERAPQSSSSVFAAPTPLPAATRPVAVAAMEPKENGAETSDSSDDSAKATPATGLSEQQVAEIKSAIQSQQKFLGELLEHGHRWELEGAELRIYFPTSARTYAEMMEGRDSLEKVRSISSKVLGRPVRVCAKLESVAAAASAPRGSASQDLRDQFERDPLVKSMMQRFGGKITEVKRNQEEP